MQKHWQDERIVDTIDALTPTLPPDPVDQVAEMAGAVAEKLDEQRARWGNGPASSVNLGNRKARRAAAARARRAK